MPRLNQQLTHGNVYNFSADILVPDAPVSDSTIDRRVVGGLTGFIRKTVEQLPGDLDTRVAGELVNKVLVLDSESPLYSGWGFSYPSVSHPDSTDETGNPELTIRSAISNLQELTEAYGTETFATLHPAGRQHRAVEWVAELDEDYQIRVRGGSGASTVSVDLGFGVLDHSKKVSRYKELWRCGIDTEYPEDGSVGARFVRTGSGVKPGDEWKSQAFADFRDKYSIMPSRLLGLVGLYAMREMEPDYAVALTTVGAIELSTLGKSHGSCDYDGIFGNVGFEPSKDPNWLVVDDFGNGFYHSLDRANIRQDEAEVLSLAVNSVNSAHPVGRLHDMSDLEPPLLLNSNSSRETIERELEVYLPYH